MNRADQIQSQAPLRLRLSWKILLVDYVWLSAASWGILSHGADMATANSRHLIAGALPNLALVAMGIAVTANAYRRGQRWSWFANMIPLFYGLPIIITDSYYVGFWTITVLPQVLGAVTLILALSMSADIFMKNRGHTAGSQQH